tara:strand:+ start:53 stop:1375 length:1323 start_codon:yes stop_codon:yes gene_type:complete
MKNILIIGAGRSAVSLIKYLLDYASENNCFITVADVSLELAKESIINYNNCLALSFNVKDKKQREEQISHADIVVSMLPAFMHIDVARDCVRLGKHLVTASYVSESMLDLDKEARNSGVILLNEVGLDPGLDHMSAMKIIDEIKNKGGDITSFKSFCGGLVHPDYDNNPWNYKFTWNPRNVVLAGKGIAQYINKGKLKCIPYHKLFERIDIINFLDLGEFEAYPNRDSLSYRKSYGLENISTLLRGTLRKRGFCNSWNLFVQLGMTDDSYTIKECNSMSYRDFTNLFLNYSDKLSVEDKFCKYLSIDKNSDNFKKIDWLGLFSDNKIIIKNGTPAEILQAILEQKWSLDPGDKDMIIMKHEFEFIIKGEKKKLSSSLMVSGDNSKYTAMAKTVGIPVAIATKRILDGTINSSGVQIPTHKNIYVPVLDELKNYGINFIEE